MTTRFTLCGDLHATSAGLKAALQTIGASFVAPEGSNLEWRDRGVVDIDITIEPTETRLPVGTEFLLRTPLVGERDVVCARIQGFARALDQQSILYQLELDDDDTDSDPVLVLTHPDFPEFPTEPGAAAMTEYSVSASIRSATFAALRAALELLMPPVRLHHDIELEWCAPDMDVNFVVSDVTKPGLELDYLVSGYFACARDEAIARCTQIADALDAAGIVYSVELDDEDTRENLLTRAHPEFPPYPAAGGS